MVPRFMVSLLMAVLAAAMLVGINETGYIRSNAALQEIAQSQRIRTALTRLLQQVLDGEASQRGYLLSGDERYLEPYNTAVKEVDHSLEELRGYYASSPELTASLGVLSRQVSRKLAEMDLSVRLRKQGNEDAWRFVLMTDVGREHMEAIRTQTLQLIAASSSAVDTGQAQIVRSLQLSRIGIAAVTLVGLIAFYMYLRQSSALKQADRRQQEVLERERDRLGDQVRERTASLAQLATHLQEVREEERGHLARELHDELGSLLTAAKLDVARLKSRMGTESPETAARLQHLTDTLNSGIALKRRIIEDLRPSSLSNLGLVAALEILAREMGERLGFSIMTNLEMTELDDSAQLTIYRLVQESLTNIGKYAQARQVVVTLHSYASHVEVEVRDDGVGFDKDRITPSTHGLTGMRHRVEAAGGKLTITSTPGKGTVIAASLPRSH
ncbi:sensor histidine kinase [Xylophilus sp. ASV27]|uniref:sensor histidine kinase n=1 Tax=Xylophilus sp. ASV27 TaxID=2795129 RepID=UPI001E36BACA|nr:CHASE3 domain-containing protein [Xylophilus sp. ASV27]